VRIVVSSGLWAALVVLSVASCGGGSQSSAPPPPATSSVRVVNGAGSSFDVYFRATAAPLPSAAMATGLAYAVASGYATQSTGTATLYIQTAGGPAPSTNLPQLGSCTLPALAPNGKYSIVIVNQGSTKDCALFQDLDYTGAPQYRMHAVFAAVGYGVIYAPSAQIGNMYTAQGGAGIGNLASASSTYTPASPINIAPFSGSISFAVGNATSGGGSASLTLDSRYIFAPNGTTQPNTTGALNVAGTAGTSIFYLGNCVTNAGPNVNCVAGTMLVGYTDSI
jgi:hypothetical protein